MGGGVGSGHHWYLSRSSISLSLHLISAWVGSGVGSSLLALYTILDFSQLILLGCPCPTCNYYPCLLPQYPHPSLPSLAHALYPFPLTFFHWCSLFLHSDLHWAYILQGLFYTPLPTTGWRSVGNFCLPRTLLRTYYPTVFVGIFHFTVLGWNCLKISSTPFPAWAFSGLRYSPITPHTTATTTLWPHTLPSSHYLPDP